ncbi:MAG: ATP-binding cassette domain-containing protein [Candidatus Pelethousia sp.]|nr:ATP-binding cassette domain-containing protein [Candidatus Pelethousia sp.]
MEQNTILSIKDIQKSFRHVQALRGASIVVKQGCITAIVGDNGSGKSTLIKILSGILKPDAGSLCVGGETFHALSVSKSLELGIRTVYQDLALDNFKNSIENIFLGAEIMQGPFLDRSKMKEEAKRLLADIRIEIPDLEEPVRNLSGGQRQGVAIARALRRSGSLLLLDEPTAAMGIHESHRTLTILRRLRDDGMTQLMISHNLHQVFSIADYIYVMRAGRCDAGMATRETSPDQLQALILQRESREASL